MTRIGRRFRRRALTVTTVAIGGTVAVIIVACFGLIGRVQPAGGIFITLAMSSIALVAAEVLLGVRTLRTARALGTVARRDPDALVFLARRLPPIVSDLPRYLAAKGLDVSIDDGWYIAAVDSRGIAVLELRADPEELLLIGWAEVGDVLAVSSAAVASEAHWCVTVDVRPYVVPMTVDVGGAVGVVTAPFGGADIQDLVAAIEAARHPTT